MSASQPRSELPRITVIGTGYLGATHAICMAALGYEVVGVDTDSDKIARLASGEVPFFEPGLPELLAKALDSGRLRFNTSFAEAAAFGDVHFICVGTPQQEGSHAADMRFVDSAFGQLAGHIDRPALLVGKSTVPVGTASRIAELVQSVAPAGALAEVAWCPEFLREGFAVEDTMRPERLVFGVSSAWAEEMLRRSFAPVITPDTPVVVTDTATAELVKVAANSFLATKISYINAMAQVCEVAGADVRDLATAIGLDSRIGKRFLRPGLGFGGGCLPKDIRAFTHRAEELGVGHAVAFLREVDAINQGLRERTVGLVQEMAGGSVAGIKVAALGIAFKPDSDDIRDAPALEVIDRLRDLGADVRVFDPVAMENACVVRPDYAYCDSALDAARDADVVILLTEWAAFREIDPNVLGSVVRRRCLVDGRHALDSTRWRAADWRYKALGRPA